MDRIWIKNPLAILVPEGTDAGGGIVVQDAVITETVLPGRAPSAPPDAIFDAGRHVVLPGLINAHHHFCQTLTRAFPSALDRALFAWLKALYPVWTGLTAEHMAVATRLALVELLRSGCTTASDHHYMFPAGLENAVDIQVAEAVRLGMRVVLTRGSMSLSVDEGGLPPRAAVQDEDTILADSERLIRTYHQTGPGARVQVALAPCAPFTVSEALMMESARLARKHGVRLHTHLAETEDETAFCLSTTKMRPLDYLEKLGWLSADVWLAHGIHFNADEMRRLGKAGVGICHCPGSNMILASGICPTRDLEAAGCPVGLGVDGSASNDCSNLIQEVRQAFLLQRLRYGAGRISHRDALRWATAGSARCLGREDIGVIAPGKQADLALFTLDDFRFSGAGDPLAALVLCGAHQADRVMVAGRWIVEAGEVIGVDREALMAAHNRLSRSLAGRA